jgi:hypothetical protein
MFRVVSLPIIRSDMSSWWWVEIPPEACRAVYRYKSTVYSCILLHNYWHIFMMHGPLNIKFKLIISIIRICILENIKAKAISTIIRTLTKFPPNITWSRRDALSTRQESWLWKVSFQCPTIKRTSYFQVISCNVSKKLWYIDMLSRLHSFLLVCFQKQNDSLLIFHLTLSVSPKSLNKYQPRNWTNINILSVLSIDLKASMKQNSCSRNPAHAHFNKITSPSVKIVKAFVCFILNISLYWSQIYLLREAHN